MNYRRPDGPVSGRGRQQPPPSRDDRRTPPPANSGRVVGGRTGGRRDRHEPETERVPRRDDPKPRPAPRTSDARWQPRPEPAPRPRPRRTSRPGLTGAKTVVAFLSVLVLVGTGYYWNRIDSFTDDLITADVIDAPPVEKPADGAIDILMVGMDSRTDAQGHPLSDEQLAMLSAGVADGEQNTDTLIMIRIPNDGGPAVGVSMPRDSYVDIPGYGQHKINSAYARAKNDALARFREEGVSDEAKLQVDSNQEGAKKLIETVQELTGAGIDHYAEVNLLGFYDITNAIGGIDVCLNAPVDDEYSGARFPAGPQNLAGVQALAFVRQRHGLPNGDLDRIVRQQVFMSGMAKKVFSGDMLTPGSETLDKLQAAIQKSVVLDQDWNIMQFAQQMIGITGGKVEFKTIPHGTIDLQTESDGSAVEIDPTEVKDFVSGLIAKKDDDKGAGEPQPGGDDSSVDNSKTTVNVRNATDRGGLAGSVADVLGAEGFVKGEVDNADPRDSTVVRHAAGEKDAGDRVAAALGGNVQVEEDANLPVGSVTVLLGADYEGPGASGSDSAAGSGDGLSGKRLVDLSGGGPARTQAQQPNQGGCVN
ncbi:LCP family protein [Actinophytocola algeriensis]|uniref:LCP family protein required for cell wall assembly n=1 Tax=Actinophytocola algeriensis TaxID=1768010 RepID=A0A7W7VBN5_9PSEU|nr:LCP family protein [Actinophytocola algeriensis]MBB4904318.1 LCP family protein required for cell wall assembly [Actinophytocola algeriensis]MBE1476824.1 LCP family protein required for cell wall assembly [Actinophytocola algeriensis]